MLTFLNLTKQIKRDNFDSKTWFQDKLAILVKKEISFLIDLLIEWLNHFLSLDKNRHVDDSQQTEIFGFALRVCWVGTSAWVEHVYNYPSTFLLNIISHLNSISGNQVVEIFASKWYQKTSGKEECEF